MDKDTEMLQRIGNAVIALQIKYRSSSLSDRIEIRPELDELLKKYADYQIILLKEGVITTDTGLQEMAEIQKEIDWAAEKQAIMKVIARTIAFVATKIV